MVPKAKLTSTNAKADMSGCRNRLETSLEEGEPIGYEASLLLYENCP